MTYELFILTVNGSCITILLILAFILLVATKFKGESGYAAAAIVIPTIPVYFANMSRVLEWYPMYMSLLPVAVSINTLQMPLLWLVTKRNLQPDFKTTPKLLLHAIPMVFFLLLYAFFVNPQEHLNSIIGNPNASDGWIGDLNAMVITIQLIAYSTASFRYIFKRRKEILTQQSDAEWLKKEWVFKFMLLYIVMFVLVMVFYAISPVTDAWLIQIFNVIAMSYLTYNAIANPMVPVTPQNIKGANYREEDLIPDSSSSKPAMEEQPLQIDAAMMEQICAQATEYLKRTKSYLRSDLSLAILAKEMDISQRKLSTAINAHLNVNFFEFINSMRVKEAKRCLLDLDKEGYNIDSVYSQCGFRSRSTFFMVFKKHTGITPAIWLKQQGK